MTVFEFICSMFFVRYQPNFDFNIYLVKLMPSPWHLHFGL